MKKQLQLPALFLVFSLSVYLFAEGKKAKILTNHIGYETSGFKHAVVLGQKNDVFEKFTICEYETDREVYSGIPQQRGPVHNWKDWFFWTIDFDEVKREGKYIIECLSGEKVLRTFPFLIQDNILERKTISDVLYYFKGQRCSGLLDKADSNMRFDSVEGKRVDLHGGWYDATGDFGKHLSHLSFSTYFNPQQTPLVVWSLFKVYENLTDREDANFRQYRRRILDEAMYGADYLVRAKNPAGSFYRTISGRGPEKRPEDRVITGRMRDFAIATVETKDAYRRRDTGEGKKVFEVSYRSGAGISIAALAMAAAFSVSGDFNNGDYLKAAEAAFAFLEKNNSYFTNDGRENIVDDYCALAAAVELYKATKNAIYKKAADKRAEKLMERLTTEGSYRNYWRADDGHRPFFHAADAGFPVISLLYYLDIAGERNKRRVLETVKKALIFELELTAEVNNPFGYGRQLVQNLKGERWTSFFFPHETETSNWWQGENARLGSLAAAARTAAGYFKQDRRFCDKLQQFAQNQLNWILGLNPFDVCMLEGSGRNNPQYLFFGSYEYSNSPGGICNGITGGLFDRDDIDFQVPFSKTGKDHDWRWGEQWLPHASWFLLAVSTGK